MDTIGSKWFFHNANFRSLGFGGRGIRGLPVLIDMGIRDRSVMWACLGNQPAPKSWEVLDLIRKPIDCDWRDLIGLRPTKKCSRKWLSTSLLQSGSTNLLLFQTLLVHFLEAPRETVWFQKHVVFFFTLGCGWKSKLPS